MSRRKRWVGPPPGSQPNREPGEIIELISDDEKGGKPLPPLVELRPCGPPLEIIELYPAPLPPEPPPFDRASALAGLHAAFAQLSDEELEVARVRMLGVAYWEISDELGLLEDEVEKLWKRARRKLGTAIFGTATTAPVSPEAVAGTGTPPETGTPPPHP